MLMENNRNNKDIIVIMIKVPNMILMVMIADKQVYE